MPNELWLRDDAFGHAGESTRVRSDNPLPIKNIDPDDPDGPNYGPPRGWTAANMTTQTTTTHKKGSGVLHAITFNKPLAAGVVAIYDGLDSGGKLIGTITFPATLLNDPGTKHYDAKFFSGLTVITSGATQDITVTFA